MFGHSGLITVQIEYHAPSTQGDKYLTQQEVERLRFHTLCAFGVSIKQLTYLLAKILAFHPF